MLNLPSDFIKLRAISVKPYYDSANDGVKSNTDDKNISNATDFSNAVDFSDATNPLNATDQISEIFFDNQLELTASTKLIIRDRNKSRKHLIEVKLIF